MEVKTKGIKELEAKLKQLPKNLGRRAVLNAMRPAARMVRDEIKKIAPSKTGSYKKSIKVKTRPIGKSRQNTIEVFVSGDFRKHWLEHGTSKQPAQPHFRPAGFGNVDKAQKQIRDRIWGEVEKVIKK